MTSEEKKELARCYSAAYRRDNSDKYLATQEAYRVGKREKFLATCRRRYEKEKIRRWPARRALWMKRYREKSEVRLAQTLRVRVRSALKGKFKTDNSLVLLGCEIGFLKTHLENHFRPGMSWKNYGPVWHVDHFKPCASFDLILPEQQKLCFHYSNLRPLFAVENLRKGSTWRE